MLNAILICVVSYLRASSASVLFSFDNIRSKIIGKIYIEIYIYIWRTRRRIIPENVQNSYTTLTKRVNICASVRVQLYARMYLRVRVISQMIAFCAQPRKYARLRQRLPPFWTIFNWWKIEPK